MRLTSRTIIFCISLLFFIQPSLTFANSKVKIGDRVPNFILEGTDDIQHELEKMQGEVVVLFIGSQKPGEEPDRELSKSRDEFQVNSPQPHSRPPREPWLPELFNVFQEETKADGNLNIFEVAGMEGTALMPKPMVRAMAKKFMKDEKLLFTRILLFDWEQEANKLLGAGGDKVNIFVIDKKGFLVHYQAVPYSRENFSVLKNIINETLKGEIK